MVKPKSNAVSKKSISAKDRSDYFTERVYFWQKALAFTEVEINVFMQEDIEARASWEGDISGGMISIAYSEDWVGDSSVSLDEVDKVAFHEVFESQFFKLVGLMSFYYSSPYIQSLLHEITGKAENSIYIKLKDLT